MVYSKGIFWLDDCRIPFVDDGLKEHIEKYGSGYGGNGTSIFNAEKNTKIYGDTKGRFTPNLLVCDDMLNDGSITGGKDFNIQNKKEQNIYSFPPIKEKRYITQDKGTNSRYYSLDLWFNKMVDEL